MSAFGRRNGSGGPGGARPSFGVARPMKGGVALGGAPAPLEGGDQFPPIESVDVPIDPLAPDGPHGDAMQRLSERQAASGEAAQAKVEGFEA